MSPPTRRGPGSSTPGPDKNYRLTIGAPHGTSDVERRVDDQLEREAALTEAFDRALRAVT